MEYINGSVKVPADETNFQTRKKIKLILHAILASVSEAIVPFIASSQTSHQAWKITRKTYANKSRSQIMSLKERLSVIQRGEQTITKYLQQIRTMEDDLSLASSPVVQDDLILYTLKGVDLDYREIAAAIVARDTCISFEDIHDKLTDFKSYLATSKPMGSDVSLAIMNATNRSQQP